MAFDQFLLNSHIDYSGSYTDDLVINKRHTYHDVSKGIGLPHSGAEVYFSFDNSITDDSGNGHTMVLASGTLQYVSGPRPGISSLYFDGYTVLTRSGETVDNDINMWTSNNHGTLRKISLEALIKPSSLMFNFNQASNEASSIQKNGTICMMASREQFGLGGSEGNFSPSPRVANWFWTLSGDYYPNVFGTSEALSLNNRLGLRTNNFTVAHTSSVPKGYGYNAFESSLEAYNNNDIFSGSLPQGYYPDIWQHLVVTCEEISSTTSETKFYINGELLQTHVTSSALSSDYNSVPAGLNRLDSYLWIGGSTLSTDPNARDRFVGHISDLHIYTSKILTLQEIRDRYENAFVPEKKDKVYIQSKTDNSKQNFINKNIKGNYSFDSQDVVSSLLSSGLKKNLGFINLLSPETIWDSLVPSPVDYHIKNGGSLVLGKSDLRSGINGPSFAANNYFFLPLVGDSSPNFTSQGAFSNTLTDDNNNEYKIGDTSWQFFFPFEQKYNSLKKLFKPSYFLNKTYEVKLHDAGFLTPTTWHFTVTSYTNNYVIDGFEPASGVLDTPVKTGIFSGILTSCARIFNSEYYLLGLANDDVMFVSTLIGTKFNNFNHGLDNNFQATDSNYGTTKNVNALVTPPSLNETYKYYFGRGRKKENGLVPIVSDDTLSALSLLDEKENILRAGQAQGKLPASNAKIPSSIFQRPFRQLTVSTSISGWKYGLYSALPSKTSAVFRRDRYGQFRDMLEQRIYTRTAREIDNIFKKNETRANLGVVQAEFIVGSDAKITSSNPSLNPTDSGIYEKFYTSGKPYSDSRD